MCEAPVDRVTFVVGTTAGGTGAHVRMLAAGLARRAIAVTVAAPSQAAPNRVAPSRAAPSRAALGRAGGQKGGGRAGGDPGLDAIPDAAFTAVEFGDRPRPADAKAVLALRRLLTAPGTRPDVVHAHGMRAGALTVVALAGTRAKNGTRARNGTRAKKARAEKTARAEGRPGLVVTTHNAPPPGGGAARLIYLALERIVARGADLVLAVSPDLEKRMRDAGARAVTRAVVPAPPRQSPQDPSPQDPSSAEAATGKRQPPPRQQDRDAAEPGDERPLVLAVGRLAPQKGFATLLDAAASWRHLAPRPRLVIAGDGPLKSELQARARARGIDAEFPGHLPGGAGLSAAADLPSVPGLLAAASVFVMPSLWEGQPLALQEALRAGVPVVASDTGGIPGIVGDAAILVEPGSAERLGQAVLSVLDDHDLACRLRAAAARRAAALPTVDDAVTAVLAAYASVRE